MINARILCGKYWPSKPFIEGGCMFEWSEEIDPDRPIKCPGCGTECPTEYVRYVVQILYRCVVSVVGCEHKAFTFSRRNSKPYFYPVETAEEAREAGELGDIS